jgi:hypothetical protein
MKRQMHSIRAHQLGHFTYAGNSEVEPIIRPDRDMRCTVKQFPGPYATPGAG